MDIKKNLSSIVFAGSLALGVSGCSPHEEFQQQYQEGKVTKESGTVLSLMESSGALFGNESIKFGKQNYILTVETDQGKYVMSVYGSYSKPIVALAEAIEVGDRIKFKINDNCFGQSENIFSKDRIGSISSDSIELLGK